MFLGEILHFCLSWRLKKIILTLTQFSFSVGEDLKSVYKLYAQILFPDLLQFIVSTAYSNAHVNLILRKFFDFFFTLFFYSPRGVVDIVSEVVSNIFFSKKTQKIHFQLRDVSSQKAINQFIFFEVPFKKCLLKTTFTLEQNVVIFIRE